MARTHGKNSTYNSGCRCVACRKAHTDKAKKRQRACNERRLSAEARGLVYVAEGIKHGTAGYTNECCRCDVCRESWNGYQQVYQRGRARLLREAGV